MKRYTILALFAIGLLTTLVSYDTGPEKDNVVTYQMQVVDKINDYVTTNAEVAGTGLLTSAETVESIVIDTFGEYPEATRYPERRTMTSDGYTSRLLQPPDS